MKVAASPRIYMGRCPKVSGLQVSRLAFTSMVRLIANEKDSRASLEMTIRESDVS